MRHQTLAKQHSAQIGAIKLSLREMTDTEINTLINRALLADCDADQQAELVCLCSDELNSRLVTKWQVDRAIAANR